MSSAAKAALATLAFVSVYILCWNLHNTGLVMLHVACIALSSFWIHLVWNNQSRCMWLTMVAICTNAFAIGVNTYTLLSWLVS